MKKILCKAEYVTVFQQDVKIPRAKWVYFPNQKHLFWSSMSSSASCSRLTGGFGQQASDRSGQACRWPHPTPSCREEGQEALVTHNIFSGQVICSHMNSKSTCSSTVLQWLLTLWEMPNHPDFISQSGKKNNNNNVWGKQNAGNV